MKRLTIKVKFKRNKTFFKKKEKSRIHVILHPINTIMQRKKAVNYTFNNSTQVVKKDCVVAVCFVFRV